MRLEAGRGVGDVPLSIFTKRVAHAQDGLFFSPLQLFLTRISGMKDCSEIDAGATSPSERGTAPAPGPTGEVLHWEPRFAARSG